MDNCTFNSCPRFNKGKNAGENKTLKCLEIGVFNLDSQITEVGFTFKINRQLFQPCAAKCSCTMFELPLKMTRGTDSDLFNDVVYS